ncbi:uncharacterized protein MKZ38_010522 [Zalerion maritima]|uniref:C2H2-type domain-containing protein n=1 Tax=Zalerion maritima TaxID=339359 RepID=A0AAD5RSC4_9PEZI|nr:uncharacterized protein MKZ38_010522 [Zalerion maritima]
MSAQVFDRTFMDPSPYATMTGHDDTSVTGPDATSFPDPADVQGLVYHGDSLMGPDETDQHLNLSPTVSVPSSLPASTALQVGLVAPPAPLSPQRAEPSPSPAPSRAKLLAKPERDATKNLDGKYECSWEGCTEEVKTFSRRCEYNKHMDKHDRPYKCAAPGCEKLPGFTYSGGLLRHEREVHGLYGGPKNPLHCPHPNCKRHSGKGFSRQENLNEHLRRVHTTQSLGDGTTPVSNDGSDGEGADKIVVGHKRKRSSYGDDGLNVGEELRKLKSENQELRKQIDAQNRQTVAMMNTIAELQATLGTTRVPSNGNDMM